MWCAYVLKSLRNGRYYTGSTDDLPRRLAEHEGGKSRYTRNLRPLRLVYAEACADRLKARRRERFLKSGAGREFLKVRIDESAQLGERSP